MGFVVNLLILAAGLALLVKGSDFFVKSSASIAKKLGVSEFVIGLTLVAVGTSIPELASSVFASLNHAGGLVIGNVAGSNIANIGLIAGIGACLAFVKTKREMIDRDGYIMLFVACLFFVFILNDLIILRWEAAIFLLLYIGYVFYLFEAKPKYKGKYRFRDFLAYFYKFRYVVTIKSKIMSSINRKKRSELEKKEVRQLFKAGLIKDILILIIAGAAIVFGAKYLVNEAIFFADMLKIPQTIIGITLIAVSTSLPELMVTISAVRKGYGTIALGNVIGSNITNIFLILGVSGLIYPLAAIKSTLFLTAPFVILMSILLLIFIKSYWQIRRIEGIIFIILYAVFIAALLYVVI
ncbi:calcium/sodium antiporter [Candidatus Woesearchaeota archaeon]|nr:calcium/sodium antiporter [Candidatus Woesearchaeota archaeon]